jgi:hypothetical protein
MSFPSRPPLTTWPDNLVLALDIAHAQGDSSLDVHVRVPREENIVEVLDQLSKSAQCTVLQIQLIVKALLLDMRASMHLGKARDSILGRPICIDFCKLLSSLSKAGQILERTERLVLVVLAMHCVHVLENAWRSGTNIKARKLCSEKRNIVIFLNMSM